MKRLFFALLASLLLFFLVGCSNTDTLNEKEKFVCDAISDNFQNITSIEVKSGMAYDDKAYLTISYTDESGTMITGQFKITASTIMEISSIDDKQTTIARYLELSTMTDNDLDYSEISAYLNKKKT